MPFLLTCDHCGAKLRTTNAVAMGRQVGCPKCKKSFVVSATNCQEEGAPKPFAPAWEVLEEEPASAPEAVDKNKAGLARKKLELAEEEDGRPPRRKHRNDDVDDEDDRPRRKKSSKNARTSSNRVALIAGGGILLVALIGAGVYFVTRGTRSSSGSGSDGGSLAGNESRLNTRPKREIPKELFVYFPSVEYRFGFTDYTAGAGGPAYVNEEARELGLKPEMIAQCANYGERGAGNTLDVYALGKRFDLAKAAETAKWDELKVTGAMAYRKPKTSTAVFQPKPSIVVVLKRSFIQVPDTKLLQELINRKQEDSKVPDVFWSLIQEVSGSDHISGYQLRRGDEFVSFDAKFRVDGGTDTELHHEGLTCWECANAQEAKRGEEEFKRMEKSLSLPKSEFSVVGKRLYRLIRSPKKDKKK
jgi:hypothetical protein